MLLAKPSCNHQLKLCITNNAAFLANNSDSLDKTVFDCPSVFQNIANCGLGDPKLISYNHLNNNLSNNDYVDSKLDLTVLLELKK